MDWTDLHFRQLARLISDHTWLWTEMVVDKTVLHTPQPDKHLWFPPEQHPIVLQLGGSDPDTLRQAAAIAARYGCVARRSHPRQQPPAGSPAGRALPPARRPSHVWQLLGTCMKWHGPPLGEAQQCQSPTPRCRLAASLSSQRPACPPA
jgi:tRNA-dihydrouridine synthase A